MIPKEIAERMELLAKREEAFELGVMRYENEKNTETAQMDN
jgi:hypothetical protein